MNDRTHPVSDFENFVQSVRHAMVLNGKERSVKQDTQCNEQVKRGVVHEIVDHFLEFQPKSVIDAALGTFITISVH